MNYEDLVLNFDYDPETGVLSRLTRKGSSGSIDAYGYLVIKFKGSQYKAHRLIWMYVTGSMPEKNIDHINGDKTDNRISNLRDVSQCENCRNATIKPHHLTGVRGVYVDTTKRLKKKYATKVNKKTYRFYSVDEAKQFRLKKLKEAGYGPRHM